MNMLGLITIFGLLLFSCSFLTYSVGVSEGKEQMPECPTFEPVICPSCPVCQKCQTCTSETIIETQEVYIEPNENDINALVYLKMAKLELEEYYNDFEDNRYSECENKTKKADDYLITAMGYYQLEKRDLEVNALEKYLKAVGIISNFCSDANRDETLKDSIKDDYTFYFNRYNDFLLRTNVSIVFEE